MRTIFRSIVLALLVYTSLASAAVASICSSPNIEAEYKRYLSEDSLDAADAVLVNWINCEPRRGELQIERLRLALIRENWDDVSKAYEWLLANGVPESALKVIDAWISVASNEETKENTSPNHNYAVTLGVGFDSNPFNAPSDGTLAVYPGGEPQLLELGEASRPKASLTRSLAMSYQYTVAPSDALSLDVRVKSLDAQGSTDRYLAAGFYTQSSCFLDQPCNVQIGISQRDFRGRERQIYAESSLRSNETDYSVRLSKVHQEVARFSAIGFGIGRSLSFAEVDLETELEVGVSNRTSAERASISIISWRQLGASALRVGLSKEFDAEPYSPYWWGGQKRNLATMRVDGYIPLGDWQLSASVYKTSSAIALFKQHGIKAELSYRW